MPIKIPFRKVCIPEGLLQSIEQGLKTGGFDSVSAMEEEIVSASVMEYALSTSTSTSALHLAMCALDLKRGDKVLCPVNSFVDIPEVVRHFDAEPVFVDTLPGSYGLDPAKLAQAAEKIKGKKLRAVLLGHPGGRKAPMQEVREVADEYGLKVIEDASERLGASDIGRFSDMATVGFGSKTHNDIDGGVLLSSSEIYYQRAKLLRNHGLIYTSPETSYMYDVVEVGCEYRMNEYSATYCRNMLEENGKTIYRRQEIARIYVDSLSNIDNILVPPYESDHTYMQFIIEVGTNRDAFARKLMERGVEVNVQYIPLNLTKYYKEKYSLKVFDFPTALDSYQKMMSLPIYASMSDDDVQYVCTAIKEIAKTHR
jgi:dTDP-4-amino-4,6-dideoxygalactose transaminase